MSQTLITRDSVKADRVYDGDKWFRTESKPITQLLEIIRDILRQFGKEPDVIMFDRKAFDILLRNEEAKEWAKRIYYQPQNLHLIDSPPWFETILPEMISGYFKIKKLVIADDTMDKFQVTNDRVCDWRARINTGDTDANVWLFVERY